ncbi:MAG: hypothetical protein WCP01_03775 [Methylococcaceae bacterium]
MNIKARVEKLEIVKDQEQGGHWSRPIEWFYGDTDAPLVWIAGTQTLDDFYNQKLPGLDSMYQDLPEFR